MRTLKISGDRLVQRLSAISHWINHKVLEMFIFRRFMAEKSIGFIIVCLTLIGTVLSLPNIGLYYGLSEWAGAHTGGVIDGCFIALVDTALESPWGQIAMIPMLAWIANSAPKT